MNTTLNIFISHSWDYSEAYKTIKSWLDESYFYIKDYSIPIEKQLDISSTKELKQKITNKISLANYIIIPMGMYTAYSEWIDYEIDEAKRLNKYIIGIKPWGQERTPVKIQTYADTIIGWNKSSLLNALYEL